MRLSSIPVSKVEANITPLIPEDEQVVMAYQGIRDYVVFTNRRIVSVNVQGITGKKKAFSSIPYSKISAYAVETAGTLDMDSELDIYVSGLGNVMFEFSRGTDICAISRFISSYVY